MIERTALQRLWSLGQSVWLDGVERGFVRRTGLAQMIADHGVSGVTFDPQKVLRALEHGDAYDESIRALAKIGLSPREAWEAIVIEDTRAAADELVGIYAHTNGHDGLACLDVPAPSMGDATSLYRDAKRLWTRIDRWNLMLAVPGTTSEGREAVRRLVADGVNVSVTRLCAVEHGQAALDAILMGLEERAARHRPVHHIACVASFCVNRIDELVDPLLSLSDDHDVGDLHGQVGVACARAAYQHLRTALAGPRWGALADLAAQAPRLAWRVGGAGTPASRQIAQVDALMDAGTILVLPRETLLAYRRQGEPTKRPLDDLDRTPIWTMPEMIARLAAAGISWSDIASRLTSDGAERSIGLHDATLAMLHARLSAPQDLGLSYS